MASQTEDGVKYVPISADIPRLLQSCQARQPAPENPTKAWKNFNRNSERKKQLKEALHARQNGLCAYCEIELAYANADTPTIGSHVDHILPKEKHPELTFDYVNLVLSCFATGGEIKANAEDSAPISCGHAVLKQNNNFDEALFIKPTEPNCEQYFSYELDGEVVPHSSLNPTDATKAEHTLAVLNLNCLRLKRLREDTITQLYQIIVELQDDAEALRRFLMLELQENKSFISARKQQFG